MNRVCEILFSALRSALFGVEVDTDVYQDLSVEEWIQLYCMSVQQGVMAIVYDVVSQLPKESQPPRNINIQWALSMEAIEKRYARQVQVAQKVSTYLKTSGITCPIMKGVAISLYYPKPAHRECGDVDLYSGTSFEEVNQLMERYGANVKRDYYVHSHIYLNNVVIENHQYCMGIRGSRLKKQFATFLQQTIYKKTCFYLETNIVIPSSDFNALFLTMHGLHHFLSEGIKLRHILDWALLLKAEQNNINWEEFYYWADKMHMTRFADALTAISVEHFGLEITNPKIHTTSPYVDRILDNTLYNSEGLFNKGYSAWKSRLMLVRNKLMSGWKYHKIYQKSIVVELSKSIFAFFFEKNPKL